MLHGSIDVLISDQPVAVTDRAVAFAGIAVQASSDDELVALWLGNYRSKNTRRGYGLDVAAFRASIGKPLRAAKLRDVQEFAASLTNFADTTAVRRLAAVKSLISFAHRIGYLVFNIAAPMQLPAVKDRLAERIILEADLQHMLGGTRDPRDAALLRLTYGAGMRVSEVCGLHWRDFVARDEGGQVTVFGKGGKTREVLLPQQLWDRVIALREDAGDNDPVFLSRKGRALCERQARNVVYAARKRAGLSQRVSPHWLRHAHVSHSLDRGAPIHVVKETVGHASLTTTTRYSHARPGDSSARYLNA
jgi:integrase/recombinase XerD